MTKPSREKLEAILDGDTHAWIWERLYELGDIRFSGGGKYDSVIGVDDIDFEDNIVMGRAYCDGGDCHPTLGIVKASVDDLLSAETAHESWKEEQRIKKEQAAIALKAKQEADAIRKEQNERAQLRKLKEKYE